MKNLLTILLSAILSSLVAASVVTVMADDGPAGERVSEQRVAAPIGTAFTYQGRLDTGSGPATGAYDLRFRLYEDIDGATALGTGFFDVPDVAVTNGLFTVDLDFLASPFNGQARFLEVRVRPGAETGGYTPLVPLQRLRPTPYALYAGTASNVPWSGITGVPASLADGDNDTTYTAVSPLALTATAFGFSTVGCVAGEIWKYSGASTWSCEPDAGTTYTAVPGGGLTLGGTAFNADPAVLQKRVLSACPANSSIQSIDVNGGVICDTDDVGSGWSLTGNAGTTGANFLGTTDNTALELRVNGQRAMRIVPNATSPNIIGGYSGNVIGAGVSGGTISGGGQSGFVNSVGGSYGTVGGGVGNTASNLYATVGGGNVNIASGSYATVGGGIGNTASAYSATVGGGNVNTASNLYATVAGGYINIASGSYATVGGGNGNTASAFAATVPGGANNRAQGVYSFAAGQNATATAAASNSFIWSDGRTRQVADPYVFQVHASGGIWFEGPLYVNGGIVAGSDLRLKRDIATASYGLAEVMQLQAKSYRWNEGSDDREHLGFIAQDIQPIIPELVSEMRDGMLGVEYTGLIPVLTRAIQEQQAQIEAQGAKIQALTNSADPSSAPGSIAAATADSEPAPANAPTPTISRETTGPSSLALWAITGAILVFAAAVFSRRPRRSVARA